MNLPHRASQVGPDFAGLTAWARWGEQESPRARTQLAARQGRFRMNGKGVRIVPEERKQERRGCTAECIEAHRSRKAPSCTCGAQSRFVNPEVWAIADALEKRNGHIELGPVHRMKPA